MKSRSPIRSDEGRALVDLATASVEPGIMVRAKRLHRRQAVTELEVEPGQLVGLLDDEAGAGTTTISIDNDTWKPGSLPQADELIHDCTCDAGGACEHVAALLLEMASSVEENQRLLSRFLADPTGTDTSSTNDKSDVPTALRHLETLVVPVEIHFGEDDEVDIGAVIAEARRVIMSGVSRFRSG